MGLRIKERRNEIVRALCYVSIYTGSYFHLAQKQRNCYIFFCEFRKMNEVVGVKVVLPTLGYVIVSVMLVLPTQAACSSIWCDGSAANII
jgi:hypothetical protein